MKTNNYESIEHVDDETVVNAMREGFLFLMKVEEGDGMSWNSTMSDLIELCHAMWLEGLAVDGLGQPLTFTSLLHRMCEVLHMTMPRNHTAVVNNIRRRKSPCLSLQFRCKVMMACYHVKHPIERMVTWSP
jgi:hypothetical protein